jgi:hypothetical protein
VQGRLKPGRLLLVDTQQKVFMKDEDIKASISGLRPYKQWLQEVSLLLQPLPQSVGDTFWSLVIVCLFLYVCFFLSLFVMIC